jgi:hypothetical protein
VPALFAGARRALRRGGNPPAPAFPNNIALARSHRPAGTAYRPDRLPPALPFLGGPNFTPALRAFESPIAMACFRELTACLPSWTCSISSRTNSPACVLAALPCLASWRARSTVRFSGILPPGCRPHQELLVSHGAGRRAAPASVTWFGARYNGNFENGIGHLPS